MQTRQFIHHPVSFYFGDSGQRPLLSPKKLKTLLEGLSAASRYLFWRAKDTEVKLPAGIQLELGLSFCGKAKIRGLNREYRNKDKATDVLSFPMTVNLRHGIPVDVKFSKTLGLGDIVICREVAISQAKRFNISIESEITHLAIHGLLHLCGYDHELSDREEKVMEGWEKRLLDRALKK